MVASFLTEGDVSYETATFQNTIFYSAGSVFITIPLALLLALALNSQSLKLKPFWRLVFFSPIVTSVVAAALTFKMILNSEFGLLNYVIGFIGMIIVRNLGDQLFSVENNNFYIWLKFIEYLKILTTVFLTMAMAAVGISINIGELRSMGYKPFIVGLIAAVTVGIISLIYIETVKQFLF